VNHVKWARDHVVRGSGHLRPLVRLRHESRTAVPKTLWRRVQQKLIILDTAGSLKDLSALPGNRLEALRGTQRGRLSIRVNEQYRSTFRFEGGNCHEVGVKTLTRDVNRPRVQIPPGEILLEEFLKPANLTQVDAEGAWAFP